MLHFDFQSVYLTCFFPLSQRHRLSLLIRRSRQVRDFHAFLGKLGKIWEKYFWNKIGTHTLF